jgi:hypothetical protein
MPTVLLFTPWQSIAMDFVGPLTESQGFKNILVIMDQFSGFLLCFPLPEKYSAIHAADTFLHTFYGTYGLPETIISDSDSRFTGKFWQAPQNPAPDVNGISSGNQRAS